MTIIIRAKSAKIARAAARNTVKTCFNVHFPAAEKRHKNGYTAQYWKIENPVFFDAAAMNQILSGYVWKHYKHNNSRAEIEYEIK